MLLQVQELSSAHPGHNVAHAVIVADLGVLVIPGRIPGLSRQKGGLLDSLPVLADQHAAARCGNDLIAIKGINSKLSKGSGLSALIGGA